MQDIHGEKKRREVLDLWPDVGRDILGIGRNQTYAAAKSGQIPTIRIGGRILVPRAALMRLLSGEHEGGRAA